MMHLRWAAYLLVLFAAKLFVWLTAGFWARASVKRGWRVLPGKWRYLHPADDDLDGGQHQLGWPPATGRELAKQRARWLRRNPAWGVSAYVLGFHQGGVTVTFTRNEGLFDVARAVRIARMTTPDGKRWFEWKRDVPTSPWTYAKLWFGWNSSPKTGWHSLEFEVNPFRRRRD